MPLPVPRRCQSGVPPCGCIPPRALAPVVGLALLLVMEGVAAQVVPATPRRFTQRALTPGGSSTAGIDATPKPAPPKVREVVRIVLSEHRQFRSTDGKTLSGRVIAFDPPAPAPGQPVPPADPSQPLPPGTKPTVVRDGKVRLLVDSKTFEVPLDRLCEDDRRFVEEIRARIDR